MKFMNEWDIEDAMRMYRDHPVLGPATRTLSNLRNVTNGNSDGWHMWPKPARAAAGLMELIERDGTNAFRGGRRSDATVAEYKRALRPVKAFRTRMLNEPRYGQRWNFAIEEPGTAFAACQYPGWSGCGEIAETEIAGLRMCIPHKRAYAVYLAVGADISAAEEHARQDAPDPLEEFTQAQDTFVAVLSGALHAGSVIRGESEVADA